jgi:hypothetical protein
MLNPSTFTLSPGQIRENGIIYPWFNLEFLKIWKHEDKKEWDIFEFGIGWGTYWHSIYVNSVTSVDHDFDWYNEIRQYLNSHGIDNVTLYNIPLSDEYEKSVTVENKKYDCIIIDGRRRVNCLKYSIQSIKDNGIIVLDNSDRIGYKEIFDILGDPDVDTFDVWGTSYWRIKK